MRGNGPKGYRAILCPTVFDNSFFWNEIKNYENGFYMDYLFKIAEGVPHDGYGYIMDAPNNLIYYPSCPHLINCLTRNISESRHLAAVQNIMIRSIAANYSRGTLTTEINTSFALRNAPAATGVRRPENLYPGFIGHPDFVRPMSSRFLMSVLAVVGGGIAALIVAFALLHAAALATTGVAVAAVGAGLLLGSVGMFHRERNKNASEGGLIDLPTLA